VSGYSPDDLEPAERPVHRLLSTIPPQPLPLGFRDAVMRRVMERAAPTWEWIVAGVLALPSLAFLAFQLVWHGDEFSVALNNVVSAAAADSAEAFFFIDGTTVLALALLGVASLLATHASVAAPARRRGPAAR
jgi:hypothetical protein